MPRSQVATVANYDFGAPVSGNPLTDAAARVLVFKAKDQAGGKLTLTVEADDAALAVSVLVSEDGATFAATTAAANGEAVTAEAVAALCNKTFEVVLRAGKDKFFALGAVGGGRGRVQIRESQFEIVKV